MWQVSCTWPKLVIWQFHSLSDGAFRLEVTMPFRGTLVMHQMMHTGYFTMVTGIGTSTCTHFWGTDYNISNSNQTTLQVSPSVSMLQHRHHHLWLPPPSHVHYPMACHLNSAFPPSTSYLAL